MIESITALGLSTRGADNRLSVWLVEVQLGEDGEVKVAAHEPWRATKLRDAASQLIDAHDTLTNHIDAPKLGEVRAVAVKRAETPQRGRPSKAYEHRIRFEGAAMLAAHAKGTRYRGYRDNQLGPGKDIAQKARAVAGAPTDDEPLEALNAACAALSNLNKAPAD